MVVGRQQCNGGSGLGLAEGVDKPGFGEPVDSLPDYFHGHGSGPVGNHVQSRQIEIVKLGMVHQPLQHGWDQHCPVYTVGLCQSQPFLGFELPHYHQGTPSVHGRQRPLKPRNVVQRDRQQVGFFLLRVGRVDRGK